MSEKERLQTVAVICFGLGSISMGFTVVIVFKIVEALA